jgi:hypothetical protein
LKEQLLRTSDGRAAVGYSQGGLCDREAAAQWLTAHTAVHSTHACARVTLYTGAACAVAKGAAKVHLSPYLPLSPPISPYLPLSPACAMAKGAARYQNHWTG